jgi:hypothetical protein
VVRDYVYSSTMCGPSTLATAPFFLPACFPASFFSFPPSLPPSLPPYL